MSNFSLFIPGLWSKMILDQFKYKPVFENYVFENYELDPDDRFQGQPYAEAVAWAKLLNIQVFKPERNFKVFSGHFTILRAGCPPLVVPFCDPATLIEILRAHAQDEGVAEVQLDYESAKAGHTVKIRQRGQVKQVA